MKMTLQKAMKARNLIKAEIAEQIRALNAAGCFEQKEVKKADFTDEFRAGFERDVPLTGVEFLDGGTRDNHYKKIADLQEVLYNLNVAIEKSNQACHILLMEEAFVKSRLDVAQGILAKKRNTKTVADFEKIEFVTADGRQIFTPYVRVNAFGFTMDFVAEVKALQKRLSEIRDEISVLNATTEIEVELPEEFR